MKIQIGDNGPWKEVDVIRVWHDLENQEGERLMLTLADDFVQVDKFGPGHLLIISGTVPTCDFLDKVEDGSFDIHEGMIPISG
jgi:hypothetical protein